jgi:hypothetical protein
MHERNKWTAERKKKKEIDGIRKIVIDIKKGRPTRSRGCI